MYSTMVGPNPVEMIFGTAAMIWSRAPKGASTVAPWAGRGTSLTMTSVAAGPAADPTSLPDGLFDRVFAKLGSHRDRALVAL